VSARKAGKATPEVLQVSPPETRHGKLRKLGGSTDDNFNNVLANQVVQTLRLANSEKDERDRQIQAALSAMLGVQPRDELEGTLGRR
jgi:hypothetical protein